MVRQKTAYYTAKASDLSLEEAGSIAVDARQVQAAIAALVDAADLVSVAFALLAEAWRTCELRVFCKLLGAVGSRTRSWAVAFGYQSERKSRH